MPLVYRVMYAVGFTPWDNQTVPVELSGLVEEMPAGRALDIGCGTGTQAVYLAGRGWEVTAVDAVAKPLRRARARAAAERVTVDFRQADVVRLAELGLAPGFDLLFDRGCYHGLRPAEQSAYVAGIDRLAAPDATLLMMAFERNRVAVGPAGVNRDEVVAAFPGWQLVSAEPDRGRAPSGPLREVPLWWYRLRRSPADPRP